MNRDNHDKQMLKAIQRIARSLESLVQIEMIVHEDLLNTVGEEYMQGRTDDHNQACEDTIKRIIEHIKLYEYNNGTYVVTDDVLDELENLKEQKNG